MKILVRATNWLGDAVLSLPALRTLRDRFPRARIVVLARPSVAALYQDEQSIDSVIFLEGVPGARDWAVKWRLGAHLRREKFDLAILLPNSFESAAIVYLSGAQRRIGYARDGRSALLTDAIPVRLPGEIPLHERYYYLELLRRAGLIENIPKVEEIRLGNLGGLRSRGEALFAARGMKLPLIGVNPGAAYGSAKRWLPDRFAAAARAIAASESAAQSATIAVFGAASERELCGAVAAACGGHNLAGSTTLREFIDMSAACRLILANDSGAMHVAAAVGVPSVTVFGPTDETATGPVGATARVIREPVECAPCRLRECPIDHRCMTRVTVDQMVEIGVAIAGKGGYNS